MTKERDYQELYDRLLEEVSTLHRNNRGGYASVCGCCWR